MDLSSSQGTAELSSLPSSPSYKLRTQPNAIDPDRSPNQKKEVKLKEKLAKQRAVWRKESLEKRPKSQPVVAKHTLNQQSHHFVASNNAQQSQHRPKRSLRPTSPYESAFTRQVVNQPNTSKNKIKRTPSPYGLPSLTEDVLKKKVEKAKKARFYLLQQAGPNSFIIGSADTSGQKYKVVIGPQSCTCGKPHCLHLMFVMVRVFQLTEHDPILYARVLKNFEVEGLFRKYADRRKQRLSIPHSSNTDDLEEKSRSHGVKAVRADVNRANSSDRSCEMEVICPICLLEFDEDEQLIKCEHCHNKLHQNCISVWFQLVSRQGDALNCPLCRGAWPSSSHVTQSFEGIGPPVQTDLTTQDYVNPSPNSLGVSPVSGFAEIEPSTLLPRSQPIPEEYRATSVRWIEMFDENIVGCLFTKSSWAVRETALRHLTRAIIIKLSDSSIPGGTADRCNEDYVPSPDNQSSGSPQSTDNACTTQQAQVDMVLEISCEILSLMVIDPVYRVFVSSLRSLRTMLSYCILQDVSKLKQYVKPIISNIILKCADGNRKTNQLSLSTLCEFAKGQDGELAIARELDVPDQPGFGGSVFILECCISSDLDSQNIQWLNGRLITMNQILEEFPGDFTLNDTNREWLTQITFQLLLPTIDFALKAMSRSGNCQRTIRLAKKIVLQCSRYVLAVPHTLHKISDLLNQVDVDIKRKLEKRLMEMSVNILQQSAQHHVSFDLSPHYKTEEGSQLQQSNDEINQPSLDTHDELVDEDRTMESVYLPDDKRIRRQLCFGQIYQPVQDAPGLECTDSVQSDDNCEVVEADGTGYANSSDVAHNIATNSYHNFENPSATSTQQLSIETDFGTNLTTVEEGDSTLTEYNGACSNHFDEVDSPPLKSPNKKSPRKLSRGRDFVSSKPSLVLRSPASDDEDVDYPVFPEVASIGSFEQDYDEVDDSPRFEANAVVPLQLNRDESIGFDVNKICNEQDLKDSDSNTDDLAESVSIPLSSDFETSDDGFSSFGSNMIPKKAVPFKKYRKNRHSRSRTDPVRLGNLGEGRNSSPRYHSDPAMSNSTSSSSTPRSNQASSSSQSQGQSNDDVVMIPSQPAKAPPIQNVKHVDVSTTHADHVPSRSASLKSAKGSQIPLRSRKSNNARVYEHSRSASDSSAGSLMPLASASPHDSNRQVLSRRSSDKKITVHAEQGASVDSSALTPAGLVQLPNSQEPTALRTSSSPRVKREIQLPESSHSGHNHSRPGSPHENYTNLPVITAVVHPQTASSIIATTPDDDSSQSDSLLRLAPCESIASGVIGVLSSNSGSSEEQKGGNDSLLVDDLSDTAMNSPYDKPVSFTSEVPLFSPRDSSLRDADCHCKDEVELEEAIALAKAMELSSVQNSLPMVPGLSSGLVVEETITIHVQDETDSRGSKVEYLEGVHWKRGMMIGTGAFSTCYQCRDVKTGIVMAVKQISFCRNSQKEQDTICNTVIDEIRMMATLNHPNIVRILGATKTGAHFNMFVEWMPGGSVTFLLEMYGAFSEPVICSYSQQALLGLAYLHDHGILHRDLKGANLLVDSTGKHLRIGDFGACARLASSMTGAGELKGQLLGTIAFMAPEVLKGEHYGRACDVWSVGCVMIEMATTKPPWNASNVSNHLKLIFTIASANTPPPIPDNLEPAIKDLMLRCFEVEPKYRPTAKELLQHPLYTQCYQFQR